MNTELKPEISTEAVSEAMEEAGYDSLAFIVYLAYCGEDLKDWQDITSEFDEAYCGKWDSTLEFATQLADDTGMLSEMSESLKYYFDYEKFGRDLFMGDYWEQDGYIFRSI